MSQYQDYGFNNNNASHIIDYLWLPLIKQLKNLPPSKILDLGCGNGSIADKLIKNNFDVYGTDASEKGITLANTINKGRFAIQNLESDDLPPEFSHLTFNTIISTEVIEHLYNPRGFLDFCVKVLKQANGDKYLIITTPYHGYFKNLLLSLFNKWDFHASPLWDGGHIKLWSRKTLTQLLEEKGFEIVKFTGCGRLPYLWMSMMICAKLKN